MFTLKVVARKKSPTPTSKIVRSPFPSGPKSRMKKILETNPSSSETTFVKTTKKESLISLLIRET
jgi:hypothetical protein